MYTTYSVDFNSKLYVGYQMKTNRYENLIGTKFGRWKILGFAKPRKHRKIVICECDCGIIKEVFIQNLILNKSKSCGCLSRDINWKGYGNLPHTYYSRLKKEAEYRNLSFTISIEDLWNLYIKQNGKCALSGVDIVIVNNIKEWYQGKMTASVDRINSTKGYEIDNVQWIHKHLNQMKMDLDQQIFINWCKIISKYHE